MTPTPTGRRATRNGHDSVVLDRTFRAPIESVWAAVTESDRLERWVGTWTGSWLRRPAPTSQRSTSTTTTRRSPTTTGPCSPEPTASQ